MTNWGLKDIKRTLASRLPRVDKAPQLERSVTDWLGRLAELARAQQNDALVDVLAQLLQRLASESSPRELPWRGHVRFRSEEPSPREIPRGTPLFAEGGCHRARTTHDVVVEPGARVEAVWASRTSVAVASDGAATWSEVGVGSTLGFDHAVEPVLFLRIVARSTHLVGRTLALEGEPDFIRALRASPWFVTADGGWTRAEAQLLSSVSAGSRASCVFRLPPLRAHRAPVDVPVAVRELLDETDALRAWIRVPLQWSGPPASFGAATMNAAAVEAAFADDVEIVPARDGLAHRVPHLVEVSSVSMTDADGRSRPFELVTPGLFEADVPATTARGGLAYAVVGDVVLLEYGPLEREVGRLSCPVRIQYVRRGHDTDATAPAAVRGFMQGRPGDVELEELTPLRPPISVASASTTRTADVLGATMLSRSTATSAADIRWLIRSRFSAVEAVSVEPVLCSGPVCGVRVHCRVEGVSPGDRVPLRMSIEEVLREYGAAHVEYSVRLA